MSDEFADPRTVAAITEARRAYALAEDRWLIAAVDAGDDDPAAEAQGLARDAVEHLDAGRWDEARDCAEEAVTLAETHGRPKLWRNFALLVEEAAEIGRSAQV